MVAEWKQTDKAKGMVDVSNKNTTVREAAAKGKILMQNNTLEAVKSGRISKGDVFTTSRIAGIMAAKNTENILPLCHQLSLDNVTVNFEYDPTPCFIEVEVKVKSSAKTGVEMEALTGVTAACLNIYDMCKAIDKEMKITDIRLTKKTGGRSGDVVWE